MSEIRLLQPFKNISKFSNIAALFKSFYAVYRGREEPHRIVVDFARDSARQVWIFPDKKTLEQRFYKLHLGFALAFMAIYWATTGVNIYKAIHDIVYFGENSMFFLAATLVFFTAVVVARRCDKIDAIVTTLNKLHLQAAKLHNEKIKKIQRQFFIAEALVPIVKYFSLLFVWIAIGSRPFILNVSTPIPALFPFNLQDNNLHPLGVKFVYIFQMSTLLYIILILPILETLGIGCILQIALNLRILAIQLRMLGKNETKVNYENFERDLRELVLEHQTVISLVKDTNDAFYFVYIVQMGTSMFLLGLLGFVILLTKNNVLIALEFALFMVVATVQLFYWCFVGSLAYCDSMEVAVAAYDVPEWYRQSPKNQQNLRLLIMRAQKPLIFCPEPLQPLTVKTFTKIVKMSYTAFTVLCTGLE